MSIEEQKDRAKVLKDLGPLSEAWESYNNLRKVRSQIVVHPDMLLITHQAILDLKPHLSDPDQTVREMFETESTSLRTELDKLLTAILPGLILPPLPTSHLPTLMSLNAGAGGQEAALFCEELARMYTRFAERRGWKIEVLHRVEGTGGKYGDGIREMTMRFEPGSIATDELAEGGGLEVYGLIKWERGVHRVQRVPATEREGRIHTSTATVVVRLFLVSSSSGLNCPGPTDLP